MKLRNVLMGAAASALCASAALAERGSDGQVNILYWQAVSIMTPYLSSGTKDIQRIRAHLLVGRRLQGKQPDLRTVAVCDDKLMPSSDWRHRLGDSVQQIASLHLCLERLSAAQEGVAAKRHDHEHQYPLLARSVPSTKASTIDESLGSSTSANS